MHQTDANDAQTAEHGSWLKDVTLLTLIAGCIYGFFLSLRPLGIPDVSYYADLAVGMLKAKTWVTPYLNGVKDLSQPPLFQWLQIISIKLFGLKPWALRLWPTIFAVLGVITNYTAARLLLNRRAGLIAASVTGTAVFYILGAQAIGPFTAANWLLAMSLLSFFGMIGNEQHRKFFSCLFWVFTGLSFMMVGLAGFVLPILTALIWILAIRGWLTFKFLANPLGIVLFLLITVPWLVCAGKANPHFYHYFFIEANWQAFWTHLSHFHLDWWVVLFAFIGLLPWAVFVLPGVWYSMPKDWDNYFESLPDLYFLLWLLVVLFYVLISPMNHLYFTLILFTPASLIVTRYLSSAWIIAGAPYFKVSNDLLFMTVFIIVCILAAFTATNFFAVPDDLKIYLWVLEACLLGFACIIYPLFYWRKIKLGFVLVSIFSLIIGLILTVALPVLDKDAPAALMNQVNKIRHKDDVIVSYNGFLPDLALQYSGPIITVNWHNPPAYGKQYQNTQAWVVSDNTFWPIMNSHQHRFFIFANKTELQSLIREHQLKLVIAGNNTVVLSND